MGSALKSSALYRNLKNAIKAQNAQANCNESPQVEEQDSTLAIPNFLDFESFKEFLQNLEANSKEAQRVKEKFLEGLEQFDFALKYLTSLSVQEQILAFLDMIEEVTLDDVGGGRISVVGILETRGVCFPYVIIPEFNAGNVPSLSDKDLFLNTAMREKIGLPTRKSRENLQKQIFYLQRSDNFALLII